MQRSDATGPSGPPTSTPFLHTATVSRLVNDLLREAMAPADLTPSEYAVLSAVLLEPDTTITDLADLHALPLASMSDLVRDLTGRGLLDRHPDARDRRRLVLSLTDEGHAAHRRAQEWFGVAYEEFLRNCRTSPEIQVAMLTEMVDALSTSLRALRARREGSTN